MLPEISEKEVSFFFVFLKGASPLSKEYFVQYNLHRYICRILLEKQFVEV